MYTGHLVSISYGTEYGETERAGVRTHSREEKVPARARRKDGTIAQRQKGQQMRLWAVRNRDVRGGPAV